MLPEEDSGQEYSGEEPLGIEGFLVECLAWGLLQAYDIEEPPVPVREMIQHPLPIFGRLTLLELNLGLYDATYKLLLDGSQLIAVDLIKSYAVQRASMARELYVAFCHSFRAAELSWPCCETPYVYGDFFARCLLMPAAWVRQACAKTISVEGLTARFGVPCRMAARRLSEVDLHRPQSGLGKSLTEALFSLREPWRNRFLDLVTELATNQASGGQLPTQDEMATWLDASPGLYQDIKYMLDAWRRPGNIVAHQASSLVQDLVA